MHVCRTPPPPFAPLHRTLHEPGSGQRGPPPLTSRQLPPNPSIKSHRHHLAQSLWTARSEAHLHVMLQRDHARGALLQQALVQAELRQALRQLALGRRARGLARGHAGRARRQRCLAIRQLRLAVRQRLVQPLRRPGAVSLLTGDPARRRPVLSACRSSNGLPPTKHIPAAAS